MNVKPVTTAICIALTMCVIAAHAGTVPSGVHADASWFAHADMPALKATAVGQKILTLMREGRAADKFAALSAVYNFDPRSDLKTLTLYGFGKDHDGAMILRGAFDAERMLTLVRASEDYQSERYAGHVLHSWTEVKHGRRKRTHSTLQAVDTLVFADDLDVLKSAVDVLDGRSAALAGTERFPGLDDSPRGGFIFAAANMTGKQRAAKAQVFRLAQSAVFTVGETDGLVYGDIVVETANAEAAMNMKRVVDGMVALALLNRQNNPAGARLAESAEAVVDGSRLTVTLCSPVADVIARIEKKCP